VLRERIEERFGSLDRRELIGLAVLAVLIVGGVGFWYVRSLPSRIQISTATEVGPARPGPAAAPTAGPTPSPAAEVVVDVAGWVRHPGVYRLHTGDRVIDAIDLAGGAKPRADLTSLNLAALLTDGEQIIVLRIGHAAPGGGSTIVTGSGAGASGASGGGAGDLVNLNTATLDQLEGLPGIGPVLAQKILDYRTDHGPFKTIEGLMDVSGIGDKRFADLKAHITV
jgi:competence protein ComEA